MKSGFQDHFEYLQAQARITADQAPGRAVTITGVKVDGDWQLKLTTYEDGELGRWAPSQPGETFFYLANSACRSSSEVRGAAH